MTSDLRIGVLGAACLVKRLAAAGGFWFRPVGGAERLPDCPWGFFQLS